MHKSKSNWMKHLFVASVLCLSMATNRTDAAASGDVYKGLEYFGSSQISSMELEKLMGIKPGASLAQVQKGLDRLDKALEARHLPNNLEVVGGEPGSVYVAVDIFDSQSETVPTRKLRNPRHVLVRSEKPFLVYDQLTARLQQLTNENRPWTESVKEDGCRYYSDEPSNQYVEEIKRFAPEMKDELIAVVESDPDATRRKKAVELLSWAGEVPYVANRLTDAFDDSDPKVRVAAMRYVFPRLAMLPEEYPWIRLIQGASRELNRPSHQDRSKALYLLLWIAKKNQLQVRDIKELDEARLKQLSSDSVLPTVKGPSQQLLAIIAEWDKGPIPGAASQSGAVNQFGSPNQSGTPNQFGSPNQSGAGALPFPTGDTGLPPLKLPPPKAPAGAPGTPYDAF